MSTEGFPLAEKGNEREQEVKEKLAQIAETLELFEKDIERREVAVQFDGRDIRISSGDHETRGGEIEGLSADAIKLLKQELGIEEGKSVSESITNPNNGQGDLREDSIRRYRTNIPYLKLEEWVYDEAWHGKSSGTRAAIDPKFGPEVTENNPKLKIDLEKVSRLLEERIRQEVDSVTSEFEGRLNNPKDSAEFKIPLWEDYSQTRTSTGTYEVRGGGRIGISPEAEVKLLSELGIKLGAPIDCSDAAQVQYDRELRTERHFTPTKYQNIYFFKERTDGGWHGSSEEFQLVRIDKLPPTFEENTKNYKKE